MKSTCHRNPLITPTNPPTLTHIFIVKLLIRMTDEEKKEFFHDFIFWQQEGLDIEKQHCLFINFGVNVMFEYTQIRKEIMIYR